MYNNNNIFKVCKHTIPSCSTFLPAHPELSDPEPSCLPSMLCRRQPKTLEHSPFPLAKKAVVGKEKHQHGRGN